MITVNAQSFTAALPNGTTVRVIDGSITLDEAWTTYATASVTVPLPVSLTAFDPRTTPPPRVKITIQQDYTDSDLTSVFTAMFGGGTTAALTAAYGSGLTSAITAAHNRPWISGEYRRQNLRSFDLGIRSRERGPDNTLILQLASDEGLLQDWAPMLGPPFNDEGGFGAGVVPALNLADITAQVLALPYFSGTLVTVNIDRPMTEFYDGPYGTGSVYGIPWQAGVTAFDFLTTLLDVAGARLWCDENKGWHLDPAVRNNTTTTTITSDSSLTDYTDTIDRDGDWYNAVVYRYRWVTTSGVAQTGNDYANGGMPWSRTKTVEVDLGRRPNSFSTPLGAAVSMLAQVSTLGRTVPVSAVNDFSATPGGTLTVTLPDATTLSGRIASVAWDLKTREMRLETRNMS